MKEYEKRGYLQENFRLFHLRSEGGTRVDLHYHEFCKLLLLISGQGSYYIDGQHYLLDPGDIVTVGSHSIHKPELSDSVPYERIILYVSPAYLQSISAAGCDLTALFSGKGGHVLHLQEKHRKQVFRLAQELEDILVQDGYGKELLSTAGLLRLLVELGRCMENRETAESRVTEPESRRIRQILAYLDENLGEPIDMDRLSQIFFISKYHMMRSFRKETGTTIYTYLTRKRLLLARERMAAGMSATEACFSCGFHSYSSFTRSYAKLFGTTPTGRADRRLIREEGFE